MKRTTSTPVEQVVSKKARVRFIEKSMKTKIMEAGDNMDTLWALISDDIHDGFEKVVSEMDASMVKKLTSDIASYKSGCVFVEFLSSDFEKLFWKIEDKYELPLGYFEKFYDDLVDPVNFIATNEIKSFKKAVSPPERDGKDKQEKEDEEPEAIETGSSSSEEEVIDEIEDVDENNDYSDDDYDPNDEDNYSDDSENDSILMSD